jgi:hypothetical protein
MQISPVIQHDRELGLPLPYGTPQIHAPGSIAQGDTIDNNDNLPDAGGGVIARTSNPLWPGKVEFSSLPIYKLMDVSTPKLF